MLLYLSVCVFVVYFVSLVLLWLYSIGTFSLAVHFFLQKKHFTEKEKTVEIPDSTLPFVTVQLPIYNEKYVIERLMEALVAHDYPLSQFEIQILDDSTDETTEIIEAKIQTLKDSGIQIRHIRRAERQGFKAGALADAFPLIQGEFVAIFDADFAPRPDFLRKTMAYLIEQPAIGLLQTRWEHLNQTDSLLTELQAFHLDAHFAVEQFVRSQCGWFMNFNGTAGVWRKQCIQDGGGWQADTLTEDLDLSYRSQLAGWKMHYLDAVGAPAELPVLMSAVKSQQFRWMKGGAEVGQKLLGAIWKAKIPLGKKLHGTHHLLGSSVFILSLITGLLSLPLFLLASDLPPSFQWLFAQSKYLFSSFFFFLFFYLTANVARKGSWKAGLGRTIVYIFPFLTLMMGLSLHNAHAAWLGLLRKNTPFIRTPKFQRSNNWRENSYRERKISGMTYWEILLALYFSGSVGILAFYQNFMLLPFQLMLMLGYITVIYLTFKHTK